MIKKQFATFLIRWLISSVSMWICINLFATFKEGSDIQHSFWMYAAAGLVFSLVNAAMVGLTIWIIPDVYISFWGAVGSCLVISVINFLVNLAMPDVK